jgi:hypothetical protein
MDLLRIQMIIIIIKTDEQLHFLDRKALEAAMSDVNGSFGKGIVTRLGSAGGALVSGAVDIVCIDSVSA